MRRTFATRVRTRYAGRPRAAFLHACPVRGVMIAVGSQCKRVRSRSAAADARVKARGFGQHRHDGAGDDDDPKEPVVDVLVLRSAAVPRRKNMSFARGFVGRGQSYWGAVNSSMEWTQRSSSKEAPKAKVDRDAAARVNSFMEWTRGPHRACRTVRWPWRELTCYSAIDNESKDSLVAAVVQFDAALSSPMSSRGIALFFLLPSSCPKALPGRRGRDAAACRDAHQVAACRRRSARGVAHRDADDDTWR